MIFLHKPLTVEMTELIDRLGRAIAQGDGLTPEEVIDFREWMKAARSLHHKERREASLSSVFAKRGAEVVPLNDFVRAHKAYSGQHEDLSPCA